MPDSNNLTRAYATNKKPRCKFAGQVTVFRVPENFTKIPKILYLETVMMVGSLNVEQNLQWNASGNSEIMFEPGPGSLYGRPSR